MKLRNHFPGLLSLNGLVLPFLSRSFFTDLRKASVDKPKPRFARDLNIQSANQFFFHFGFLRKAPTTVTLPFSLSCSVDFFSPHIWAASVALNLLLSHLSISLRNFSDRCYAFLQSQQTDSTLTPPVLHNAVMR